MLRHLAALAAVSTLVAAAPAIAGSPQSRDNAFKGYTGQKLMSVAWTAHGRLARFDIEVLRYCSDGSTSYVAIETQPDAVLKPAARGGIRFATTLTASNGATAQLTGTVRKDWMRGAVTFPDLAAMPSVHGGAMPAAGATCSTVPAETVNMLTFQLHNG
jgi:hypothetical protein